MQYNSYHQMAVTLAKVENIASFINVVRLLWLEIYKIYKGYKEVWPFCQSLLCEPRRNKFFTICPQDEDKKERLMDKLIIQLLFLHTRLHAKETDWASVNHSISSSRSR